MNQNSDTFRAVIVATTAFAAGLLLLGIGLCSGLYRAGTLRFALLLTLCLAAAVASLGLLLSHRLAQLIHRLSEQYAARVAIGVTVAYAAFMTVSVLLLYRSFDPWMDFDVALRNQAFWRLVHGSGFVSTMDSGINNLGIHSAYVYLLLVPLYVLLPFPHTLLVVQVLAVSAGGYLLFRCLARHVASEIALGAAVAYFSSAMLSGAVLHGIHEVTLGPPLLVLMYDSFLWRKLKTFLLWTFLFLCVKETMPLVVAGFVALAVYERRPRAWWILSGALAAAFLIVNFGVVFPLLRSGLGNSYMGLDFLPAGLTEWRELASDKMLYIAMLGAMFLFFGPLTPLAMPALSEIGINLVSMSRGHTDFNRHYAIYIAIALLVSSAFAIETWRRRTVMRVMAGDPQRAGLWLTMLLVLAQVVISPLWLSHLRFGEPRASAVARAMTRSIPADAVVMASHGFLAALSSRREIYSFYNTFSMIDSCDYLMVDASYTPEWYPSGARERITALAANPHGDPAFELVAGSGQLLLMRRRAR